MKKAGIAILIAMLALATFVAANGENDACKYAYGLEIAKFEWNGQFYEEISNDERYNISMSGTERGAQWNSDKEVGAVVSNEVCGYQVTAGGQANAFNAYGQDDIQYVVFCEGDSYVVPEFGTITATIVLLAGIGILIFNRRKSK